MNDVALLLFLVFTQRERESAFAVFCVVESFVVVVVVVVVESVCVCVCVCVCVFFVFSLVASKTHTTHKVFFDEKDEKNFEEEEKKSEKNTQTDRQTDRHA